MIPETAELESFQRPNFRLILKESRFHERGRIPEGWEMGDSDDRLPRRRAREIMSVTVTVS